MLNFSRHYFFGFKNCNCLRIPQGWIRIPELTQSHSEGTCLDLDRAVRNLAGVEERLGNERLEEMQRDILIFPDEQLTGGYQGQPTHRLRYTGAS